MRQTVLRGLFRVAALSLFSACLLALAIGQQPSDDEPSTPQSSRRRRPKTTQVDQQNKKATQPAPIVQSDQAASKLKAPSQSPAERTTGAKIVVSQPKKTESPSPIVAAPIVKNPNRASPAQRKPPGTTSAPRVASRPNDTSPAPNVSPPAQVDRPSSSPAPIVQSPAGRLPGESAGRKPQTAAARPNNGQPAPIVQTPADAAAEIAPKTAQPSNQTPGPTRPSKPGGSSRRGADSARQPLDSVPASPRRRETPASTTPPASITTPPASITTPAPTPPSAPADANPPTRIEIPNTIQVPPSHDPAEDAAFAAVKTPQVRSSSFQEITPGQTSLTELENTLGEPKAKEISGSWIYQIGPFPRVEMVIGDDVVQAIIIQLENPTPVATVTTELVLEDLQLGKVIGSKGQHLGAVYPERGIVLSYSRDSAALAVSEIMLEPVNAELFMVRARNTGSIQQRLADIRYARTLDASLAETYYLEAQVHERLGRIASAVESMSQALNEQFDAGYEVYRAELYWRLGERGKAQSIAEKIASDDAQSPLTIAAAECLLGDIAANGVEHDFAAAYQKHMKAIRLAGKHVNGPKRQSRIDAKKILVDAHLGVAGDLAWGEWRQKELAVPKWLAIAERATNNLVETEGESTMLKLDFHRRALAAYSAFAADLGQATIANEALEVGRDAIAKTDDLLLKRSLRWQLVETLYFASRCMQRQKKIEEAIQLGKQAANLMDEASKGVELTGSQRYLAGRVYFHVGSVLAINKKAHREAIEWYEQTIPNFSKIDSQLKWSTGAIGDRLVSMGVSYWQGNQRRRAIEVTERGAHLLEMAIGLRQRKPSALAIPYDNLVSMYESLGDKDKAAAFAKKAQQSKNSARAASRNESNATR